MVKNKAQEQPHKHKQDRIRTYTLSDILKAQISDKPLEWERYRADHPNRMEVLDDLNRRSLIEAENNLCFLNFNGLLLLNTEEAKRVLADCRKVFDAMANHYRQHLREWISLKQVAERVHLTPEWVLTIVRLLQRRGPVALSASQNPLTIESKIAGNEWLLRESPFRALVKRIRTSLAKPMFGEMPSNRPFLPASSDKDLFALVVHRLGSPEVKGNLEKCNERLNRDPDGAITAARSLIEGACKQILKDRDVAYSNATNLPGLYGLVANELELDPGKEADQALRKILSGCMTTVNGLAELRNIHGDSHGKAPGTSRPAQRHARLAVALAAAFATFLLETD